MDLSIGELGAAAAIDVELVTSWIHARLLVAAAVGCSGAGTAFTGQASIDLAWLDSAGMLAGVATGFQRCAADGTAAGDEVWHVAVAAGSAAVQVSGIVVGMSDVVVTASGSLAVSLSTAAAAMNWAVQVTGTVDAADVALLVGFSVDDTLFSFNLGAAVKMLVGPDLTNEDMEAGTSATATVTATVTSDFASFTAAGSFSLPCEAGDSIQVRQYRKKPVEPRVQSAWFQRLYL
jgi:hypothetical protein